METSICFPNRRVHAHRNFDVRALGAGKAPSKGPMGWIWGPLPAMLDFFYLSLNYIRMIITTIYNNTIIYYVL